MKEHIIKINANECIGCGLCKKDCPANNIFVKDKKASIKTQSCIKCGHCVAVCPKGAVSMSGFDEMPIEFDKQIVLDSEQLLKAIQSRRSVRHFKDKPISAGVIRKIIEAGRWTPTAKNAPSVSYIVLQSQKKKAEEIAVHFFKGLLPVARVVYSAAKGMTIDENFFFKKAPIAIMIMSEDKVSASLAAANMALMAEACGLGVLYSGFFTIAANMSSTLRRELGLKNKDKAVTTLVLGYPDVTYRRTSQKNKAIIKWL